MDNRRSFAVALFICSLLLWATRSDTLKLVINERAVLFNRYSEGHFTALCFITLFLWIFAACLLSRRPFRRLLAGVLIGIVSTIITVMAAFHLTRWMSKPRYIETPAVSRAEAKDTAAESSGGNHMTDVGIVRHRPPNTRVEWLMQDRPQHPRSYENAPSGYGDVRTVLTTDANGFRNQNILPRYDVVIAGDSFAAGSHVSDEQVWTELIARQYAMTVYNLGASGSSPITYLNNFKRFADTLKPKLAVFVIYEGNDFKAESVEDAADLAVTRAFAKANAAKNRTSSSDTAVAPENDNASPSLIDRVKTWSTISVFTASPIRRGLNRLSKRYFETALADRPLRDYEKVSRVMPVLITRNGKTHAYAYKSRRLTYLYMTEDEFRKSAEWQASTLIFDAMVSECEKRGAQAAFVYVPSTPHVVLPVANKNPKALPADQLRTFASFARRRLPEPDVFKQQFFERLHSQENVFMTECEKKSRKCLSLTRAMQEAVDAGIQPYYSYDQHWTPDGNIITAREVGAFLRRIIKQHPATHDRASSSTS